MVKIKLVTKNQFSQLAKIYKNSFNTSAIPENWDLGTAEIFISYLYKRQPDMFFVATVENEIAGGAAAGVKPWWNGGHIYDVELFVGQKYRKMGIGKMLLKKLISEGIKKYKVSIIEFTTFNKDSFLLQWYKKIGMKEVKDLLYMEGSATLILNNLK